MGVHDEHGCMRRHGCMRKHECMRKHGCMNFPILPLSRLVGIRGAERVGSIKKELKIINYKLKIGREAIRHRKRTHSKPPDRPATHELTLIALLMRDCVKIRFSKNIYS